MRSGEADPRGTAASDIYFINEETRNNSGVAICGVCMQMQPHDHTRKSIDGTVNTCSVRFQFVVRIDMP